MIRRMGILLLFYGLVAMVGVIEVLFVAWLWGGRA